MCLAVPAKIIELLGNPPHGYARVEHLGTTLVVDVSLVDTPAVGDYILLHAGLAINKYDPDEAREALALHEELSRIAETLDREDARRREGNS